eukprot:CAMPEP_0204258760 /NCGR_PEP_ID=MMETSP0468-20130131/5149_1 /ASSEMBLY_ACC=CAM_ASM_000383 /TAXON_ID=2969 /ORGANISM="Oxyrrhis marina" /LENGTH=461 /DNA_ID=CAMNT_0051232961 /DNA_START=59 /DNA_END=1441 /DNA_ORIENTATION=-
MTSPLDMTLDELAKMKKGDGKKGSKPKAKAKAQNKKQGKGGGKGGQKVVSSRKAVAPKGKQAAAQGKQGKATKDKLTMSLDDIAKSLGGKGKKKGGQKTVPVKKQRTKVIGMVSGKRRQRQQQQWEEESWPAKKTKGKGKGANKGQGKGNAKGQKGKGKGQTKGAKSGGKGKRQQTWQEESWEDEWEPEWKPAKAKGKGQKGKGKGQKGKGKGKGGDSWSSGGGKWSSGSWGGKSQSLAWDDEPPARRAPYNPYGWDDGHDDRWEPEPPTAMSRRMASDSWQAGSSRTTSSTAGCRVKILNIPKDLMAREVSMAFGSVGTVLEVDMPAAGEAVVRFARRNDATKAVHSYNGGDLNGRKIVVSSCKVLFSPRTAPWPRGPAADPGAASLGLHLRNRGSRRAEGAAPAPRCGNPPWPRSRSCGSSPAAARAGRRGEGSPGRVSPSRAGRGRGPPAARAGAGPG